MSVNAQSNIPILTGSGTTPSTSLNRGKRHAHISYTPHVDNPNSIAHNTSSAVPEYLTNIKFQHNTAIKRSNRWQSWHMMTYKKHTIDMKTTTTTSNPIYILALSLLFLHPPPLCHFQHLSWSLIIIAWNNMHMSTDLTSASLDHASPSPQSSQRRIGKNNTMRGKTLVIDMTYGNKKCRKRGEWSLAWIK